jgi:hypothetical protein
MSETLTPAYVPPDRTIRIAASYTAERVGEMQPAGHPETVEIELTGAAVPEHEGDRLSFVGTLVNSLFRDPPVHTEINVNNVTPAGLVDQVRTYAAGGRIR